MFSISRKLLLFCLLLAAGRDDMVITTAADLSVQLATERIRNEVTPDDQSRLVDRYLDQVKKS